MKKFFVVVVLLCGSLFYKLEDPNLFNFEMQKTAETVVIKDTILSIEQKAVVENIEKDEYTQRDLKSLYSIFRGAEIWLDLFDGQGAEGLQDVMGTFKVSLKKTDVRVKENFDKDLENLFKKYKNDERDLFESKKDVQKDMAFYADCVQTLIK